MTLQDEFRHLVDLLDKPELIWRPQQIATFLFSPKPSGETSVKLPWNLTVTVYPDDQIGEIVRRKGLYDLIVCEAIWRLVSPGNVVLDVGANLGYMTSIMSIQAGQQGSVLAFEPHPDLHDQLRKHIEAWRQEAAINNITLHKKAVSATTGEARLLEPTGFAGNRAICKLSDAEKPEDQNTGSYFDVETITLDTLCLEKYDSIELIKIDVEGAEMLVLSGADKLLSAHKIKNVIIEDFDPYPSERLSFLESKGYTIQSLGRTLMGPKLCPPSKPEGLRWGESPSYLATVNLKAAQERFEPRGWQCLIGKAKKENISN
ncbi:FkbM family methyltransferase [soil metagenome]